MSLKDSALVSVTGIVELMRASQIAAGSTRDYFLFYLIGGGCYLILTLLSNRAFTRAESHLNRAGCVAAPRRRKEPVCLSILPSSVRRY